MVKFSFVLLNLLIFFTDVMCYEDDRVNTVNTVNPVRFPIVKQDPDVVNAHFLELMRKNAEDKSLGYIRKLNDKVKVQLCKFILVNKPYELKITLEEYDNLNCIKNKPNHLTIQKCMYNCPFSIENDQVPIGDTKGKVVVDNTSNEPAKKKYFWISQGNTENDAFVYLQQGDDIRDLRLDAVVHDLSMIEKLEEMKSIGLLSQDGKKYVQFLDTSDTIKNIWNTYVKSFKSSKGEAVDAAQVGNETTNLDVRQLSEVQQLLLCYQVTKYRNLNHRLNLTKYPANQYHLNNYNTVPCYVCPRLVYAPNCRYILVNIGKPAAIVAFYENTAKQDGFGKYDGPFYMDEIDLESLRVEEERLIGIMKKN